MTPETDALVSLVAKAIPCGEPGDMIDVNRSLIAEHVAKFVRAQLATRDDALSEAAEALRVGKSLLDEAAVEVDRLTAQLAAREDVRGGPPLGPPQLVPDFDGPGTPAREVAVDLKPCPFCGAGLRWRRSMQAVHPDNGCILSGLHMTDDRAQYDELGTGGPADHGWNRRALPPDPTPAASEREAAGVERDDCIAFVEEWAAQDEQDAAVSAQHPEIKERLIIRARVLRAIADTFRCGDHRRAAPVALASAGPAKEGG